jgi:hypothetical protein
MLRSKEKIPRKLMKTLRSIIVGIGVVLTSTAYGQGYLDFANLFAPGITLSSTVPGEGNVGDYLGSDYRAALYYEIGTFSGTVNPSSLTASGSASAVPFYGTTGSPANGHSPQIDGAGLFDGGPEGTVIPGTADGTKISVEVAIWYAGPGATSYESAKALGYNTGYSSLATIRLVSGTDPFVPDVSGANSFASVFTPGTIYVPEPSTVALGALGGAALLLLRRRR